MFAVPPPWGRWETAHQLSELLLEASVILRRCVLLPKKVLLRFVFGLYPQFSPKVKKSVIEMNLLFLVNQRNLKTWRRLSRDVRNVLLKINLAAKQQLKQVRVGFGRKCLFCFFSLETKLTAEKIKVLKLILKKLSNPGVVLPLGCLMRLWWSPYLCLRKNAITSINLEEFLKKSIFYPKKRLYLFSEKFARKLLSTAFFPP